MKNTIQPLAKLGQKFGHSFKEDHLIELAIICGFVQRKPRKITPFFFVLSFFMALSQHLSSLRKWAAQLSSLCGEVLSKVAITKRLTAKSSAFAQKLFEELLTVHSRISEQCRRTIASFEAVWVQDSCTMQLQDSLSEDFKGSVSKGEQKALLRLQTTLDIASMQIRQWSITAYSRNDQAASLDIVEHLPKGALLIRDLGYWKAKAFELIAAKGAYFLSRMNVKAKLFDLDGQPLKLKDLLCSQIVDRDILLTQEVKLPVRLLIVPLPEQVVEQRIRRARANDDGRFTYSSEYYEYLRYNIFITNVEAAKCSLQQLLCLYGLRWQIEIWFKALKSGALNLGSMIAPVRSNAHRVRTVVLLAMCFVLLTVHVLFLPYGERLEREHSKYLSFIKILNWMCTNLLAFAYLPQNQLLLILMQHCCFEKRNRTNLAQRIMALS